MNHSEIVSFLWGIANLIRDDFSRGDYQEVILPFTVLRRIDQVLAPTKEKVLEENARLKEKGLENRYDRLCKVAGYAFYNTSRYDFEKLLDDPPNLEANLRNYINGFSPNMREVIERFQFGHTIDQLDQADLLFKVMERFGEVDLHPDTVPNPMMGTIFEELIRKFNEALDENPGQHFTPRDVVHLMVDLMLSDDEDRLEVDHRTFTVYDPCCGTGGMLTITKEHIEGGPDWEGLNPTADVHLYGQEVNPKTYAVCKSDLFMKSKRGRDAQNIEWGNTLSEDQLRGQDFDYLIANPPYGKDWKGVQEQVEREHEERGFEGRFGAGTPRVNDGQLLFLQHMLSHRKDEEVGGSRVAIIMNGSPLFTGDAGSGESEIRRWILENDWLEALIALPEQMFYNTGIATYVWVLSNRKPEHRQGKVQLVDATDYWTPLQKSLGDKRREIPEPKRQAIVELCRSFEDDKLSKVFPTEKFGFRKVRVERPLRLNFQATDERIERLEEERAFQNLARSRKRDEEKKQQEIEEGKEKQERIKQVLREKMGESLYRDREKFRKSLDEALEEAGLDLKNSVIGNIENALGERDEEAEICRDSDGNPEHDTDLRDYERVPLGEDVFKYFEREVEPYVPDAWIDEGYTDERDGGVGRVGYEVNFDRYFYEYEPPRPLEEIQKDIQKLEGEIVELLGGDYGMSKQAVSLQRLSDERRTGYSQYPDYEDTAVPWIDSLPSHWESMKLGYDARLIVPQRDKPRSLDGEIPWVRIEDFDGQFIRDSKDGKGVSQKTVQNMNLKVYPAGTVLCSCSCDMGATAIVKRPLVSNQTFIGIVPGERLESRYVYYLMQVAKDHLNALATGAIQQYLSKTDFSNLRLPLPSFEEQQRLTDFLDQQTGKIDRLIAKKERLIELLEERRTALITKAVTKGLDPDVPMKDSGVEWLGQIPEQWDMVSLTNLSPNITVGIVVKPTDYYEPEGVPCLRSQNVKLNQVSYDNLVFISNDANQELAKSQIFAGDLVTVRTGDPGTTAVVPSDLDGANCIDLIIIRKPRIADEGWMSWFLNSEAAEVQYRIWSGGAAQQHLNIGAVKRVRVPVPPLDEQEMIRRHLDQHRRLFRRLKQKLLDAIDYLQEYRSALITAAVTGKIDVRDHAA